MLPCKQKVEVARKLMRREGKIRRNRISCKKLCLRENQDQKREDWRGIRDRRHMIGYQFILKKLFIGDIVSMCTDDLISLISWNEDSFDKEEEGSPVCPSNRDRPYLS